MVNRSERIFGGRRLHRTRDRGVSPVRLESTPIRRRGYPRRKELSRIYATAVFDGAHDLRISAGAASCRGCIT